MNDKPFQGGRILSYFKVEWKVLLLITLSGLVYNIGLLAGPLFEGKMTGRLVEILQGTGQFRDMLVLVLGYVGSIFVVQACRYIKRFYVRRFANNVNRRMKGILYGNLVRLPRTALQEEGHGDLMTKAISDVDDCVEGMRKFTTEIFDTGVALAAYFGMLLYYDWRLALISMIFPPISYFAAEKMKKLIRKTGAEFKKQAGALSAATLDRGENAMTYRVYGLEENRREEYEVSLTAYEKTAVKANIWGGMMPPIYRVISMAGVIFILYLGQKNVLGTGWKSWDIGAFTTFLSCFVKLAVKSSSAAKLFNAVHKAQVSWGRIRDLLSRSERTEEGAARPVQRLEVKGLSFSYPDGKQVLENISFTAEKGQIIGITGPVACGKSTLGKMFLEEYPFSGEILADGEPLRARGTVCYLGHDPELFNDTVEDNILMGKQGQAAPFLKLVSLDGEVDAMPRKERTFIGSGGVLLSGGQAQRLAFARTLCHKTSLMVLDDPFSALDRNTEREIFARLRAGTGESIVLLISHRLYLFPEMDQVIWLESGKATVGKHEELMETVPEYRSLYLSQKEERKGGSRE